MYNINADTAAARFAGALEAESLICMTDTAGIMRNCDDPDSLIPVIDVDGIGKSYHGQNGVRRNDPEGGMLRRGDTVRSSQGVHHRRTHPPTRYL